MLHLCVALAVAAYSPSCVEGHPDQCAVPLRAGDIAPYAGQLLTPKLALELKQGSALRAQEARLAADHAAQVAAINIKACEDKRRIDAESLTRQYKQCAERLNQASSTVTRCDAPFYQRPWFVGPLVAIVTASAIVWVTQH